MTSPYRRINLNEGYTVVKDYNDNVAYAYDQDGNRVSLPASTAGGVVSLNTLDASSREFLDQIISELKKINIQLSLLTDTEISDGEL